jgi:hypothetical protein
MSLALSFSMSELAAGTKLFVRFSQNSIQQLHTKSYLAKKSHMKIGSVTSCNTQECQWTATRNYHIRQPILMQQDTNDFHLISTRSCELSRCRCSKSRTLLWGVNEFLSVYFAFIVRFFCEIWCKKSADRFLKYRSRKGHNFLMAVNETVFT